MENHLLRVYVCYPIFYYRWYFYWILANMFFSLHFVAGLILATIFQTAHIMPECDYPKANEKEQLKIIGLYISYKQHLITHLQVDFSMVCWWIKLSS